MSDKAGWTWEKDGKLGDKFYPNRGRRTQPTKYDIEEMEVSASNDYFNAGPDRGLLKWPELKEVGYSIVPVVMVEIPGANERGICDLDCYLLNCSDQGEDCRVGWSVPAEEWPEIECKPGPDCPAHKGDPD